MEKATSTSNAPKRMRTALSRLRNRSNMLGRTPVFSRGKHQYNEKARAFGARQSLLRNWQNGKLWWNDPDAVTLSGAMPMEEYRFHTSAIMASGGLVLSGDRFGRLMRAEPV